MADGSGEVVLADLAGDGDGYVGVDRAVVCADVYFGGCLRGGRKTDASVVSDHLGLQDAGSLLAVDDIDAAVVCSRL